ncbi:MAG: H-NS histone family protein [Burkholderiaceae bacterium]
MAKTLNQIQKQIATLQKQAESLKSRDLPGVVERIREAVAYYGITAADVFGAGGVKTAARKAGAKRGGARKTAKRKGHLPPKFRDDAGNAWSGHGKRPNWYKDALAAGKTLQDLLVK